MPVGIMALLVALWTGGAGFTIGHAVATMKNEPKPIAQVEEGPSAPEAPALAQAAELPAAEVEEPDAP